MVQSAAVNGAVTLRASLITVALVAAKPGYVADSRGVHVGAPVGAPVGSEHAPQLVAPAAFCSEPTGQDLHWAAPGSSL